MYQHTHTKLGYCKKWNNEIMEQRNRNPKNVYVHSTQASLVLRHVRKIGEKGLVPSVRLTQLVRKIYVKLSRVCQMTVYIMWF